MIHEPNDLSRRTLLGGFAALGASPQFVSPLLVAGSTAMRASNGYVDVVRPPDSVTAQLGSRIVSLKAGAGGWSGEGIDVETTPSGGALSVSVRAPEVPLRYIHLRWRGAVPGERRVLGDAWERAYGDLQWSAVAPNRGMPWYFLAHSHDTTHGYGVKAQAGALCFWQIDSDGISLWLDVRNGGAPVQLGDRTLAAATVVSHRGKPGESAFQVARALCAKMCDHPRNPAQPLYGGNNWYYAYGQGFGPAEVIRDAAAMADAAPAGSANRPFMVIDAGWSANEDDSGPAANTKPVFADMPGLVQKMKGVGARPGIWTRPLLTSDAVPDAWRAHASAGRLAVLDPSVPEVLEYVRTQIRTIAGWGYELIKHDYSTYDIFGRWGFQMGVELSPGDWHFADRTRTTAEVIVAFYRAIREAAGDAYVLGCNTMGHLSAGIFEASRIGDDTSGREWDRTWKMGVNCLAFRAPQQGTFFGADPDCVAITPDVPWQKTARWLELVAGSGTPLFVSLDPRSSTPEVRAALKKAFEHASRAQPVAEPLDWMDTTTPSRWRLDGREVDFDWSLGEGMSPFG